MWVATVWGDYGALELLRLQSISSRCSGVVKRVPRCRLRFEREEARHLSEKMQTRLPPSLAALPLRNGGNRYTGAAMSAFIKGKLKSLKEALGAKDWTLVEKLAR